MRAVLRRPAAHAQRSHEAGDKTNAGWEAGDTLIEVLVALVVLGLSALALLGAFATSIAASTEHRGLVTIDTVLKSYVESAVYQIQNQPSPLFQTSCGATSSTVPTYYNQHIQYTPPSSSGGTYTAQIDTPVNYWSPSSGFQTTCTNPAVGPQMLTAEVKFTSSGQGTNIDETIQFVVTDPPTVPPSASCPSSCSGNSVAGVQFNFPITVTGGPAPTVTATGFPAGVSAVKNNGSWFLNGTLTQAGSYTGMITASSSGGPPSSVSFTVTITPAAAFKLAFTTPPVGGAEGTAFSTQPAVSVEDQFGNVVTTDNGSIGLSITGYTAGNGGATQGTLSCTPGPPINASSGVATFAGCNVSGPKGAGTYTLSATRAGLQPATANVTVTSAGPTKLVITTAPVGGAEGTAFSTQPQVSVEDSFGNVVTSDTGQVTLSITNYTAGNGGTTQGTLSCTQPLNTTNAISGVATFTGCNITGNKGAGSYTLSATRALLQSGTANVTVTAAAAASLSFNTLSTAVHGVVFPVQPQVTILDAFNNVVTSDSSSVTISIGAGSNKGTLTCTSNPVPAASGVATFAGCKINNAHNGYTLTASDAADGGIAGTSNPFNVS